VRNKINEILGESPNLTYRTSNVFLYAQAKQ
jgi:hypothetical protein